LKPPERSRKRRAASFGRLAVRIGVSSALMIFLVTKISLAELGSLLATLNRPPLAAGVGSIFMSNLIGSYQWHQLLKSSGIVLSFRKTFQVYFVGVFFNNFLLGNVGGDAVKIYDVTRIGTSVYQVIAVTLLDRILGIFGLCLLATVATLYLMGAGAGEYHLLYLAIFIGCMSPAIGFYLFKPFSNWLRRVVKFIHPLSLDERISSVLDYLGEFKGRKTLILKCMGLSLIIQGLRVVAHIFVAASLGVGLSAVTTGYFFIFIPILGLVITLPISIMGIGVREYLGIILFHAAGINQTDAFTMLFLTYVGQVVVSLLGLVFFLMRRGGRTETGNSREADGILSVEPGRDIG
jgi:uncharacterized protein (TIRG00374 family)